MLDAGGVDINARGSQGRTALQRAAGANMVSCCQLLIERGADATLIDDLGRTTLHWAAMGNAVEVADLLVTKNVPVKALTNSGSSALHCAADSGKTEFVQWCIKNGADLLQPETSSGKTAFQLAKEKNATAIMGALKAAGAGEAGGCCVVS